MYALLHPPVTEYWCGIFIAMYLSQFRQDNFSASESLPSLKFLDLSELFLVVNFFPLKFNYSLCDLIILSGKVSLNKSFISAIGRYND